MTTDEKQWLDEKFSHMTDVIDLKLQPLRSTMHDHQKTLYGNGKDGIKTKLDRVERTLDSMKKSGAKRMGFWLAAALAGIGGIVNLGLLLFRHTFL